MHPNDLNRLAVASLMLMLFVALCSGVVHAATPSNTPDAATEKFYRWVLSQQHGGLPTRQDRAQLARLLTKELQSYLAAAAAVERQCVAVTPRDMKPPIWEGSIWVGNYEGASEAAYDEPHIDGITASVGVALIDIDRRFQKGTKNRAIAWRDTLKLRMENKHWVVSDVIWGNSGESLIAALRKYITEEGTTCRRGR